MGPVSNDHTGIPDRGGPFEDQFDRLLELSSLGSPNARAIRSLTPDDLVQRVYRRAAQRGF